MLANRVLEHPLIATLRNLRGNVRGVVLTEPLWAIPYNLYAPYMSVYMLALGLTDAQIGLLASIGLAGQMVWTMLSGAITDKFGRKRTTLVGDIIAWSIPCLIWAFARDFNAFLAAAIVNSSWRITMNSWSCLLVEATEPHLLVDVYSLIYISGLLAAFFSPIASILIAGFSLVPTMRGLFLLSFVMMTAKFLVMNGMVEETTQGRARMDATRNQPLWSILGGSHGVLREILRSPATLLVGALMVIVAICNTINTTFWSVLVTEKLQVPAEYLSIFAVVRSLTMLMFYFTIMPRLRQVDARKPLVFGFVGLIMSWTLLITMPPQNYPLLVLTAIIEGCSVPAISAPLDKLVAITVDPDERARIMALLYMLVLACSMPFGWIAGQASQINRSLPFVINIVLFTIGAVLAFLASRRLEAAKS